MSETVTLEVSDTSSIKLSFFWQWERKRATCQIELLNRVYDGSNLLIDSIVRTEFSDASDLCADVVLAITRILETDCKKDTGLNQDLTRSALGNFVNAFYDLYFQAECLRAQRLLKWSKELSSNSLTGIV